LIESESLLAQLEESLPAQRTTTGTGDARAAADSENARRKPD
jgi:hypothetical protein